MLVGGGGVIPRLPRLAGAVPAAGQVELSDVVVDLHPPSTWRFKTKEDMVEAMGRRLTDIPGMTCSFSQPVELRVAELITRSELGLFAHRLAQHKWFRCRVEESASGPAWVEEAQHGQAAPVAP